MSPLSPLSLIYPSPAKINFVSWTTIKTTWTRWEAELMEQLLTAHGIPSRVVALGIGVYLGQGSQAALQVQPQDQQTALELLSSLEEE